MGSFKEMTWDIDNRHNFFDRVLVVLIFTVFVVACVLLLILSLVLINRVAIKEVAIVSKQVVEKNFSPAHTQTSFLLVGKITMPQVQYIPDKWSLCFHFEQNTACGSVEQNIYNKAEIGKFYSVGYGIGRIDGKHIVTSIQ